MNIPTSQHYQTSSPSRFFRSSNLAAPTAKASANPLEGP
jgi:hypothetical protein